MSFVSFDNKSLIMDVKKRKEKKKFEKKEEKKFLKCLSEMMRRGFLYFQKSRAVHQKKIDTSRAFIIINFNPILVTIAPKILVII